MQNKFYKNYFCYIASFLLLLVLKSNSLKSQVKADFSAKNIKGCVPLVVQFTDNSNGSPDTFEWNFGNGNSSNSKNPSAIYSSPGVYAVSLRVSKNNQKDSITKTAFITVFSNPQADFSSSDNNKGCVPLNINFIDKSIPGPNPSAPIKTWLWSFGDGNSSNVKNPSHIYTTADNFTVTLQITDTNGCKKTHFLPDFIQTSKPTANFTADKTLSCELPTTISFQNTSQGNSLSYSWIFDDGTNSNNPNPSHQYVKNGKFSPQLIITDINNCKDTLKKNNLISIENIQTTFNTNKITACINDTIAFSDSTLGANTWLWNFGDESSKNNMQNPKHIYTKAGLDSISLTTSNGNCSNELIKTNYIQVNELPQLDFEIDKDSSCSVPFSVNIKNKSTGASKFIWDYGNKILVENNNEFHDHSYDSVGNYYIKLTAVSQAGCSASINQSNMVHIALPLAHFTTNVITGCIPLKVDFNAGSSSSFEPIQKWEWNFGDGQKDSAKPISSNTYTNQGEFDASITITTTSNCKQTFSSKIIAGNKPQANFSFSPTKNCIDSLFEFKDLSTGMTANNKQYMWNFEVKSASEINPFVNFTDTGAFDVQLIAINNGCADTLILPDTVKVVGPKARFNFLQSCKNTGGNPLEVAFKDSSVLGTSWLWNFGDQSFSSARDTIHLFDTAKNYLITLTVYDSITGCSNASQQAIFITNPKANFSVDTTIGCYPFSPLFKDSSEFAFSYLWDFGNGQLDSSSNPSITYTDTGYYNVKLTIKDIHGCVDSIYKMNYLEAIGPKINFQASNLTGCSPLPVNFTDQSFSKNKIIKWNWNFSDNSVDSIQNPSHVFTQRGLYNISLIATDSVNCSASKTINNFIEPTFPFPAFSISDSVTCKNKDLTITNNSSGKNLTYLWDFGNGTTSDTAVGLFKVNYKQGGAYQISLKLTDDNGCDSVFTLPFPITVQNPNADFSASATMASCPPFPVSFTNKSTGTGSGNTKFTWDFGDSTAVSNLTNPLHFYNIPGNYTVSLSITTAAGCKEDTIVPGLISLNGPFGSFTADSTEGCMPFKVKFTANSINTKNYIWDFGNGIVETTDSSKTNHLYTDGGIFFPALILDDGLGCTFPIKSPFGPITVNSIAYQINADTSNLCRGDSVNIKVKTISAGTNFQWYPDKFFNCINCENAKASPDSTITYYLELTNKNCSLKDSLSLHVKQLPSILISPDTAICSNTSIKITAYGGIKYQWNNTESLSCDTCSETMASPQFSSTYTVHASDSFCTVSDSIRVDVITSASALFSCEPTEGIIPLKISFNNKSSNANNYQWNFGNGKKSNFENPEITYKDTGTFRIQLIANNPNNCPDTAYFSIPVGVISKTQAPNVFTPNGDGINDFFTLNFKSVGIQKFEGIIFNRWGEEIAKWNDVKSGWNGRNNSDQPAPEGTYFYSIKAVGLDGVPYMINGILQLLR